MSISIILIFALLYLNVNAQCPDGSVQGMENSGLCYKFYSDPLGYDDASSQCYTLGGSLISIPDAFTNNFVTCKPEIYNI